MRSRLVDGVAFASTHNSMAATDDGFSPINANQHFGLRRQPCGALDRGSSDNDLFLVNDWLSTEADLPDATAAPIVNVASVLQSRLDGCAAQWGHPVNLLAVDVYDEGDLIAVVDASNGVCQ